MKSPNNKLTLYIFAAMFIGALVGYFAYLYLPKPLIPTFSTYANLLAVIFLRLIQMIISPLVFCMLTVGIAKLGDLKTVGRIGGKALLWFVAASVVSLFVGWLTVYLSQPGININLNSIHSSATQAVGAQTQDFSALGFINHLVPKSIVEAMANNEILQIVVFSIFLGIALASLGNRAAPVIKGIDVLALAILKMVNYIMFFAPMGVLGSVAATMATNGPSVFIFYARYFIWFLLAVLVLWLILLLVGFFILKRRLFDLLKLIVQPMIVAFSTTSSEAVFPTLTEKLQQFGCSEKIVSFVLPLGYSFNLTGSMINIAFASLAIAQAYHIPLSVGTQITMLFVLMLTSKGIAGVPRATLVVVAATCAMFKIPVEGIALILPIDHFCDMFRTMTNVVGNALSTASVSKWEKDLTEQKNTVVEI
jgi:Na+/H+-dicarboxylate symporter